MRLVATLGTVFAIGAWHVPADAEECAYVTNINAATVSVVNVGLQRLSATIPVGDEPDGVAITPDGAFAYVTNFGSNTVSLIDTRTRKVTAIVPVDSGPVGIAASVDGSAMYVVNRGSGTLSMIDTTTRSVNATIPVGDGPNGIAVLPNGRLAYVTDSFTAAPGVVSVVDLLTRSVIQTIPVGDAPSRVAITPDGTVAYVTNYRSREISVIDAISHTVIDTVPTADGPADIALSPNGVTAYVSQRFGTVSVIDTANRSVTTSLPIGGNPRCLALTPDGGSLYVANLWTEAIAAIDLGATGTTTAISIGSPSFAVAIANVQGGCPPAPTPTPTFTFTASPTWTVTPTPTETPILTATETVTNTPTGTRSPAPTATSTPTPAPPTSSPTVTPTLVANAVRLDLGSATGWPAASVTIPISLASNGQSVAGIENEIVFDPSLVDLAGPSSCKINPAVGAANPACEDDPMSGPCKMLVTAVVTCPQPDWSTDPCPDGTDGLKRLRAIVLSTANTTVVPDGVVYSCTFTVITNALGSAVLQNAPPLHGQRGLGASDPGGGKLAIDGRNGVIVITASAPTATNTPSRARPSASPISTPTGARAGSTGGGQQLGSLSHGGSGGCSVSGGRTTSGIPLILIGAAIAALRVYRRTR